MADKIKHILCTAGPAAKKHGHHILIIVIVFNKELGIALIVDWAKEMFH